jgi:diadenosine tetraphosphate (Ap4A) HIT family hydrolase
MKWTLDPRLEKDSIFLADFPLSHCRLMNAKEFPWILLIPREPSLRDWTDVSLVDQPRLQEEINRIAAWLKSNFPCEKLNIASLGNKIPQLHIHVIARLSTDIAWPNPVWGVATTPYSEAEIERIRLAFSVL